jgi:hypothetical protein
VMREIIFPQGKVVADTSSICIILSLPFMCITGMNIDMKGQLSVTPSTQITTGPFCAVIEALLCSALS